MNVALVVVSVVLLIVAVIGWVGRIARGRCNGELRKDKARLQATVDSFDGVEIHRTIKAHGLGGEPVTIVAKRKAVRSDQYWVVNISGLAAPRSDNYREVEIVFLNGVPTVRLRKDGKPDDIYPRVESSQLVTR